MSNFNSADIAAFKDVWVFCEQREGKLMPTDFELISKGRDLANELGVNLCGLLLGGEGIESAAKELGGYGADKVIVCESPLLATYTTDGYAKVICDVIEDLKPEAFLIGATNIGRDLGPRCAARLHTGLCADCTHLDVDVTNYIQFLRESSTLDVDNMKWDMEDTQPEDDASGIRRSPDGDDHLPAVPSVHGDGPSWRYEEERVRRWPRRTQCEI